MTQPFRIEQSAGCWKIHPCRNWCDNCIDFLFLLQVCFFLLFFNLFCIFVFSHFFIKKKNFFFCRNSVFSANFKLNFHFKHPVWLFMRFSSALSFVLFCCCIAAGVYVAATQHFVACHTTNLEQACVISC